MRSEARFRVVAGVLALLLATLVAATYDGASWPEGLGAPESTVTQPDDEREGEGEEGRVSAGEPTPPDAGDARRVPDWLKPVALAVLVALVAAACLAVLLSLRFVILRRKLKGKAPLRGDAVAPPPVEVEPDPEAVETTLVGTIAALGEGSPRNAVVACWIRLEELATARGLERHEADTPTEFVARALEAYGLDEAALEDLADLYREARFSRHELTEEHRDRARACLERLVAGLRASA